MAIHRSWMPGCNHVCIPEPPYHAWENIGGVQGNDNLDHSYIICDTCVLVEIKWDIIFSINLFGVNMLISPLTAAAGRVFSKSLFLKIKKKSKLIKL